jgi:hypothetical protein
MLLDITKLKTKSEKMILKQILMGALATLMIIFTVVSAVDAYPFIIPDLQPVSPNYVYYGPGTNAPSNIGIPTVTGPYPRYYTGFNDYRGRSAYQTFAHDDLNYYDEFVGYRDLDIFYPGRGYVDVARDPSASLDRLGTQPPGYSTTDPFNVYGVLPGGGVYRKHYYHEHPWDLGYDYGDIGGYFQPTVAYVNRPVFRASCIPRSQCQALHCGCD